MEIGRHDAKTLILLFTGISVEMLVSYVAVGVRLYCCLFGKDMVSFVDYDALQSVWIVTIPMKLTRRLDAFTRFSVSVAVMF